MTDDQDRNRCSFNAWSPTPLRGVVLGFLLEHSLFWSLGDFDSPKLEGVMFLPQMVSCQSNGVESTACWFVMSCSFAGGWCRHRDTRNRRRLEARSNMGAAWGRYEASWDRSRTLQMHGLEMYMLCICGEFQIVSVLQSSNSQLYKVPQPGCMHELCKGGPAWKTKQPLMRPQTLEQINLGQAWTRIPIHSYT